MDFLKNVQFYPSFDRQSVEALTTDSTIESQYIFAGMKMSQNVGCMQIESNHVIKSIS